MKNMCALVGLILMFFMVFIPLCKSDIVVSPAEISLVIDDMFIGGNTTKKITVTNLYSYNISVKAWMVNPDIIEWMRPNRTFIDNITWIKVEPSDMIVPSNSTADFYIYLSVPNETKNQTYDKHWETWAAFKIDAVPGEVSSIFKEGYWVRVYVDTPREPVVSDNLMLFLSKFLFYILLVVIVAVLLIVVLYRRKKKNKPI